MLSEKGGALFREKQKKNQVTQVLLPVILVAVCTAIGATDVLAGEGHEPPRWGDFGWRILNFIMFVGILWYFVGKAAVKYFRGRKQGIKDTLDGLEERRRKASEDLSAVEKRIANLNQEREAILQESRRQAQELKVGIVAEAERQAAQIVAQAKATAENEGRAVLAEVRAAIADEIVDAAEKVLGAKLNAAAHEKLIDNSLNKVVLQ